MSELTSAVLRQAADAYDAMASHAAECERQLQFRDKQTQALIGQIGRLESGFQKQADENAVVVAELRTQVAQLEEAKQERNRTITVLENELAIVKRHAEGIADDLAQAEKDLAQAVKNRA